MKILILAGQFYPDLAGSGIATCLIARFMAERGHNVTVCVDEDNRYLSEVNGHPDFKIIHIPEYKDFMTGLADFGKPARAIAKELRKTMTLSMYIATCLCYYYPLLVILSVIQKCFLRSGMLLILEKEH